MKKLYFFIHDLHDIFNSDIVEIEDIKIISMQLLNKNKLNK